MADEDGESHAGMKSPGMAWKLCAIGLSVVCCLGGSASLGRAMHSATPETPLVIHPESKQVILYGVIYPARFNRAEGDEAHYHLLTWKGGHSKNALIETPADDLAFHDALVKIGAQPGNTLSMAAWTQRADPDSPAPRQKAKGSHLAVFLSWQDQPERLPVHRILRPPPVSPQLPVWTFEGNRDRWFNRVPFALRPGCLVCLYSCPSGKLSNGRLSIADYMSHPGRFRADTESLPPDDTPVRVIFELLP